MDIFEREVQPLFEQHRAEWLSSARTVAEQLGELQDNVTIDDVRDLCPPPEGIDGRVMGAVFPRSRWQKVGYQRSRRTVCHNRPIGIFRLKEAA